MFKPIVVGYNATEGCCTAVRCAGALAERFGTALHVVSVSPAVAPIGGFGWVAPYDTTTYIDEVLRERTKDGASLVPDGVEVVTHAELGSPSAEIVRIAEDSGAGLIVLGLVQHTALERFFVGSTADRVVRLSNVPCLVSANNGCPTRILVGADDSTFGQTALEAALHFAKACDAEIRCIHVATEPPPPAAMVETFDESYFVEMLRKSFDEFVQQVRDGAGPDLPAIDTAVRMGAVAECILAEADEWKADLLVVGTHGRGFVGRAILGSVSEGLLRHSPVSVLVVPR